MSQQPDMYVSPRDKTIQYDLQLMQQHLSVDLKTGFIYRKSTGERADLVSSTYYSYKYVMLKGKRYLAHRIVWLFTYGEWPVNTIDHINRDGHDNRPENLRDVGMKEQWENSSNYDRFKENNPSLHSLKYV